MVEVGYHYNGMLLYGPLLYVVLLAIFYPGGPTDMHHCFHSAANAATYTLGFDTMTVDLNCTTFQATIGVSMYCLGFAVVPLFTASFSEEFGRRPLYVVSAVGFTLMNMMTAL